MTSDRLITTALAALLVLPAVAADTPRYFNIPGTETAINFYGFARLDATYDTVGNTGARGGLGSASSAAGKSDDSFPKNQWDMTAVTSRLGFTTTTPSAWGNVIFKVEGDFAGSTTSSPDNKGNFRLRHGFGQIGGLIAGQTFTLFTDFSGVGDMSLDWQGMMGCYAMIDSRPAQVRYTFDLGPMANLAFSMEQARTAGTQVGATNAKPFPAGLVGAFNFKGAWGYVRPAVAYQKYDSWTKATPLVGAKDVTKTSFSWNVATKINLGPDALAAHFGVGDGNYGPSLMDGVVLVGTDYQLVSGKLYAIGYSHVWTPTITSSVFFAGVQYSRDTTKLMTGNKFKTYQQAGLNTTVALSNITRFGVEYVYGKAKTFDANMITNADGTLTDTIKESKFRFQLRFMLS